MSRKKAGGPSTVTGKNKVSENALKHGATSPRFINDEERTRAVSLLEGLKHYYSSDNPLVALQLERIVRNTIQLERIQNTIDAEFEITRVQANPFDNMLAELNMDEGSIIALKRIHFVPSRVDATDEMMSAKAKINIMILEQIAIHPTNQEQFLACCPIICRYLYNLSLEKSQSIHQVIESELGAGQKCLVSAKPWMQALIDSSDDMAISHELKEDNDKFTEERIQEYTTLRNVILKVDFNTLIRVSMKYSQDLNNDLTLWEQATRLKHLIPAATAATTPNLEKLDKLMRYQTTLQRQLSSTIGELIVLMKN